MKLKYFLFVIVFSLFSSVVGNLYLNIKINELSSNLSKINEQIVEIQISKDQTFNLYQEKFSIENIENISDSLKFKKLEVHVINRNLSPPYKLDSESVPVDILGTLGK